jgi:hypothetical protein
MPDLNKAPEVPEPPAHAQDNAKPEPTETAKEGGPAVDPMQWWGSLTQQFQNIAAAAVKDVAAKAMKEGPQASGNASGKAAGKTAGKTAGRAAAKSSAKSKTTATKKPATRARKTTLAAAKPAKS